jgi:nucleotide-binding universal stress UspA family protein
MGSIVVGVDRSDTARRAAERAAVLAGRLGSDLHIVMCAERKPGVHMSVGTDSWQSDWLTDAQQFLEQLGRQLPHATVTTSVGDGDPAKAICDEARRLDADVIVVGNKRVKGLARVLGSVAGDVMKLAHCDVYVANTTVDEGG